jgi:hypothetical protein
MNQPQPTLDDLAAHLAYHASIGFAECCDIDPPSTPRIMPQVNGAGVQFTTELDGRSFCVRLHQIS